LRLDYSACLCTQEGRVWRIRGAIEDRIFPSPIDLELMFAEHLNLPCCPLYREG
jgi:hypothetical protein